MDENAGMDLLQGVQDAGAAGPSDGVDPFAGGNFEMPSLDKLLEIVEQMDMSEEDKAQLKESLLSRGDIMSKLGGLGGMGAPPPPVGIFDPSIKVYVFLAALVVIVLIFVFFGYKLYKSLVDKERKREEKKKQKLHKKKK